MAQPDPSQPDPSPSVDLALVLAVDGSTSIDPGDFRLQMDGLAAALRNPALAKAIAAGAHRRIAISVMLWSDRWNQKIMLPWTPLSDAPSLGTAATWIAALERSNRPGGTGLAAAIDYAAFMLKGLPFPAARRAIDVSGDGPDNESGSAAASRDRAVAEDITINGLPILSASPGLENYYSGDVIGGAGAFIEPAENILAFRDAILRKLLREIGRPST